MRADATDTALGWVVNVTLDSTESKTFDEMATRDYHRMVTFVVNGIAIGETTVRTKNSGGSFMFGPAHMSKEAAQFLARQLHPGP
jgi:preprotein translocase subunit SecD